MNPSNQESERRKIENLKQKIRELDAAATKGPWVDCTAADGLCQCKSIWSIPHDCEVASATKKWGDGVEGSKDWMEYGEIPEAEFQANKDFIAFAREALPALLAYCEELEKGHAMTVKLTKAIQP